MSMILRGLIHIFFLFKKIAQQQEMIQRRGNQSAKKNYDYEKPRRSYNSTSIKRNSAEGNRAFFLVGNDEVV